MAGSPPRTAAEAWRTHRFFERGEVRVSGFDAASRQAAFSISMPASVAQAVVPALLGAGVLDQYVLMNPVAAWIPALGADRIRPGVLVYDPDMAQKLNSAVRARVGDVLSLFADLSQGVLDPTDLIPMLPLGVYVTFRMRCRIDDLPRAVLELERTAVAGVGEFRFALAAALTEVLTAAGSLTGAGLDGGR